MWKFIAQIATQLSWLFNYLLFCSFAKPYSTEFELPETLLGIVHYESPNTAVSSEEEEECAVCLCKIEEGEELRELRCAHLFHKTCLDRWTALNHVTCPLCRSFLAPPVRQLKLHMSERHERSSSYDVPHYAPVLTPSFSFKGSLENVRNAFGTWRKSVGEATKKAVDIAGNSWHHLKTSPHFADAAMGRISRATKVITKGGCERIFRSTFEMVPDEEHLQHSFACYLSTSSGPVMGVLYLSTAKIAYCSDNLVLHKFENQTESGYYKVVIPLHQLKAVNPSLSKSHPGEKYIQIISTDGHELWFMGFLNYNGAVQSLQEALHVQSISVG